MSIDQSRSQAAQAPSDENQSSQAHARLMDGVYRSQRHIYDLTRKYYLLGRDKLIRDLTPAPGHRVLEVGCGTGRNMIVAARRYPEARFYGFDISEMMLETAERKIAAAGLSDRIKLAQGDASDFSLEQMFGFPAAERVFCSYTLSMIPPWKEALDQAVRAATPEGEIHVVDFGQQERMPSAAKAVLSRWLALFHVSPRADLKAALEAAALKAGRRADFVPLYRGYAWIGAIR